MAAVSAKPPQTPIAGNRRAFHDYYVEETYEAGIALVGTEVKALREGKANLQDSFARIEGDEVLLYHCHIQPYSHGNLQNHDPRRVRKLLLHRQEIQRLVGKTQERGLTLIPLKLYFNDAGRAKVELALARGKTGPDKRESIKRREATREIQRTMRERHKG
ncbi:MAG: SsrA-binding protein SmpB [Nitrospiria bacterium]